MTKTLAIVFGVVFILVGLLGFVSNPIVGQNGFFYTDMIHNMVHIIVGIALLVMAGNAAALALNIFGGIYILLAIVGFIEGGMKLLGFVGYNAADNWLHLVLGLIMVVLGTTMVKSSQPKMGQM